jgi:hypothetical protein
MDEFAAEHTTQHTDREQKGLLKLPTSLARDPSCSIERETAAWHHAMQVGMMHQVLSPGVKHGQQADIGSQVLGITSHLLKGLGGSPKQNVVNHLSVLKRQRTQVMGKREHYVKVRYR